jgi:pimeloyl-ACP methyl ester carboxylesterase
MGLPKRAEWVHTLRAFGYCQEVAIGQHRIRANGVDFNVAVNDADAGPPVLFLHGFPESWIAWRPVMELMPGVRTCAPDLRGYGQSERPGVYDVWTLIEDVRALIEELEVSRPVLVGNDWGGALVWMFGHRYSHLVRRLVIVNCTHPKTLVRAVLRFDHAQTIRIPWVPLFQPPKFAEWFLTTKAGRTLLRTSFTIREGRDGTMDTDLVDEIVAQYQEPDDMHAPVEYYRQMVRTQLSRGGRARLRELYSHPIDVPTTLIWGMHDEALPSAVAQKSYLAAGRDVEWRPLPQVGHYVALEAPELLADEIQHVLDAERVAA